MFTISKVSKLSFPKAGFSKVVRRARSNSFSKGGNGFGIACAAAAGAGALCFGAVSCKESKIDFGNSGIIKEGLEEEFEDIGIMPEEGIPETNTDLLSQDELLDFVDSLADDFILEVSNLLERLGETGVSKLEVDTHFQKTMDSIWQNQGVSSEILVESLKNAMKEDSKFQYTFARSLNRFADRLLETLEDAPNRPDIIRLVEESLEDLSGTLQTEIPEFIAYAGLKFIQSAFWMSMTVILGLGTACVAGVLTSVLVDKALYE